MPTDPSKFREELAWAAGFFDGEGCTGAYVTKSGAQTRLRCVLVIAQVSDNGVPPYVLERFRDALGFGRIYGHSLPAEKNWTPKWQYNAGSFENIQAAVALMWTWLGPVKRAQAKRALIAMRDQGPSMTPRERGIVGNLASRKARGYA